MVAQSPRCVWYTMCSRHSTMLCMVLYTFIIISSVYGDRRIAEIHYPEKKNTYARPGRDSSAKNVVDPNATKVERCERARICTGAKSVYVPAPCRVSFVIIFTLFFPVVKSVALSRCRVEVYARAIEILLWDIFVTIHTDREPRRV